MIFLLTKLNHADELFDNDCGFLESDIRVLKPHTAALSEDEDDE